MSQAYYLVYSAVIEVHCWLAHRAGTEGPIARQIPVLWVGHMINNMDSAVAM